MLHQPTTDKLHALRLRGMADAWLRQQQDPQVTSLSFDERFALLLDAEWMTRECRLLTRLLKEAELRLPDACVENVQAVVARGLHLEAWQSLRTCRFIDAHHNVLVCGPTGVGKSYLACALGQQACRQRRRVLYRRLPRLFEELALAKAEGTYPRYLARLSKINLLILDDFGLGKLTPAMRHDLLEVLDDRYKVHSTLVTSQLPLGHWHDWIEEPTVADAILDRLVHNAYKFTLQGPSLRKESSPTA